VENNHGGIKCRRERAEMPNAEIKAALELFLLRTGTHSDLF